MPAAPTPPPDVIVDPQSGRRFWTVGTLRYTKGGLLTLFAWLMWNDFFLMLMEAVKPALTGVLMRDHGASNAEIAFYLGTLNMLFTTWINPVASTWSDRTRTRWGRRRPFLFVCTPPTALIIAIIPWAPDIWNWLITRPWIAENFQVGSLNGAVLAIAFCFVLSGMFNGFILAIFQLYFLDVVPKSVLGRFNAVLKIVTTIQNFIWNYWIFGLAEQHMKWIYGGLGIGCAAAYLVSLFMVKEGEYPPPDLHPKRSLFTPVKIYFTECYCDAKYLWVFIAFMVYQGGNVVNIYRLFHWRETLGLSLDVIGKMQAWPTLALVALGYPLGALVDRVKPMRMMTIALLVWTGVNVAAYFFLRDAISLLVAMGLITACHFMFTISWGVLNIEVFPREKLGQFCSANTMASSAFVFVLTPVAGYFFDWIGDYTYAYLWSACWQLAGAGLFAKIYFDWRRRRNTPDPFAPGELKAPAPLR